MAEKETIRLSRFIHHPPAKVWQALTDPEVHARWWAAGDVKAENPVFIRRQAMKRIEHASEKHHPPPSDELTPEIGISPK